MMLELDLRIASLAELIPALRRDRAFLTTARPAQLSLPELHRFTVSSSSTDLVAPELVRGFRVDLTVLAGLSQNGDFEGGLVMTERAGAPRRFRLEAGKCLFFSADTRVSVESVTRGELRIASCYVQSLVRNVDDRRTLSDLEVALEVFASSGDTQEILSELRRAYFDLERMWSEPVLRSAPTAQ